MGEAMRGKQRQREKMLCMLALKMEVGAMSPWTKQRNRFLLSISGESTALLTP